MLHFLSLIRWKNLSLIILTQCLIKYALFVPFNIATNLSNYGFISLVFATVCIAASGNIINDIFDIETDAINKPENVIINKFISKRLAYGYYTIVSLIGICVSIYLSNSIGKIAFSLIFIVALVVLYLYSYWLKQTFLIGNIIVSSLVALSIVIVGIFELAPIHQESQTSIFKIILTYSIFAFCINLLREIIKDIQDVDGDYKAKMQTLPIVLGRARSTKIVFLLTLVFILFTIYYAIVYVSDQWILSLYFVIFIILPLIYFAYKVFYAETKQEFKTLSTILKLVMLTGLLSLLLYPLVLS